LESLSPSFFLTVPDKNPLTEWACQPVAAESSLIVAPALRLSSASTASFFVRCDALAAVFFDRFLIDFRGMLVSLSLHCDKPGAV
jgi:hypothetical protein